MSTIRTSSLLSQANTGHHTHVVQFYSEDRFLLDELGSFIGTALAAGSSAVVIATKGHEDILAGKLMDQGLDLEQAVAAGRYVALDASETLSQFMVGNLPDEARFSDVLGKVLARAALAAQD
jgi:hypothetical protein